MAVPLLLATPVAADAARPSPEAAPASPFLDALVRTGALGPADAPAGASAAQDIGDDERVLDAATASLGPLPTVLFAVATPVRDLPSGESPATVPTATAEGMPAPHPAPPATPPTRAPAGLDLARPDAEERAPEVPTPDALVADAFTLDGPVHRPEGEVTTADQRAPRLSPEEVVSARSASASPIDDRAAEGPAPVPPPAVAKTADAPSRAAAPPEALPRLGASAPGVDTPPLRDGTSARTTADAQTARPTYGTPGSPAPQATASVADAARDVIASPPEAGAADSAADAFATPPSSDGPLAEPLSGDSPADDRTSGSDLSSRSTTGASDSGSADADGADREASDHRASEETPAPTARATPEATPLLDADPVTRADPGPLPTLGALDAREAVRASEPATPAPTPSPAPPTAEALPSRLATTLWAERLAALGTRQSVEVALGGSDGTVRLRTQRDGDGVTVRLLFSDPDLHALAGTHAVQLRDALEPHFAEPVRLSLTDTSTGSPQSNTSSGRESPSRDGAPARPAPAASPRHAAVVPPPSTSAAPRSGGRVWIG